ncbi:hypothetical protein ACH9L7_05445 [Haloferax sp. S1W]|uniref:hypothetical protein n=1 Tax=Haloferax sp. S1W TaxID=3377110 RepID=UPI0037C584E2
MYRYTPSEIDYERANHQAKVQDRKNLDVKRIGNLGELAFEQFCREHLPVDLTSEVAPSSRGKPIDCSLLAVILDETVFKQRGEMFSNGRSSSEPETPVQTPPINFPIII